MNADHARMERLVAMADRLIGALEADIAALSAGKPKELRTTEPEFQQLFALYSREAQNVKPAQAKTAPRDLISRLTVSTARFRDALGRHARILARVRNASEGIIRAVAEEVERKRAPLRTYAPASVVQRRPPTAMLFNSVV